MARPFDKIEAKRLIQRAEALQEEIHNGAEYRPFLQKAVEEAVGRYIATELLRQLSAIPVEDLNRDKSGLRIGALKDAGLATLADVYTKPAYALATIRGISDTAAHTIRSRVLSYAEEAKQGLKLRLSVDRRDVASNGVVQAVCMLLLADKYIKECASLEKKSQQRFAEALEDIQPRLGTFSWLFAGKAKKARAEETFIWLDNQMEKGFGPRARKVLDDLEEAINVPIAEAWDQFALRPVEFFNLLEEVSPGVLGTDDALYGLPEDLAREIQDECFFPEGLLCTLRKYQEWGVKYILHQERVLLGDEMGLGKTIQAIAAMVSLRNTGGTHFVVICPASVLENWCREIAKHSLLRVIRVHGGGRKAAFSEWQRVGGVAVTTYETVSRLDIPEDFKYCMTVVDEAHYIKNPNTRRTYNTVKFCNHSERLLFMTGTALENKVDEMLVLIGMLQPAIAREAKGIAFLAGAERFRNMVAPVYYRRKREDVLTELPELIENNEWCSMEREEEEVYERTVLSKNFMAVRRVSWNAGDWEKSCKAKRLMEIVEEAAEEGRKVIVFSFFLDTLRMVQAMLGDRCAGLINGSVAPLVRQEIIESFDKAPAGSVLVSQIQSGGTGLNIQSASVVVICEPQFKPSIENQAISRAYRMGQTRNVLVFRLLCAGTADERMMDILETKQMIFDVFADKSVAADQEKASIDDKKFGKIIEEEIERIKAKNPELAAKVDAERQSNTAAKVEARRPRRAIAEITPARTQRATASQTAQARPRFCDRCGAKLGKHSVYCPDCGVKIE